MNLKIKQFFGWILLLAGIVIIVWVLYSSYNIFTAKKSSPEIFKVPTEEAVLPQKGKTQELQAQMEEMIGKQLKGMIPIDVIPKLLNLISWSIFAGISIFGGAQISGLGIKLLRK